MTSFGLSQDDAHCTGWKMAVKTASVSMLKQYFQFIILPDSLPNATVIHIVLSKS